MKRRNIYILIIFVSLVILSAVFVGGYAVASHHPRRPIPMQPLLHAITAPAASSPMGEVREIQDAFVIIGGPYGESDSNGFYAFTVIRNHVLITKQELRTHGMQMVASYYRDIYAKAYEDAGFILGAWAGSLFTPTSNIERDRDGRFYLTSIPKPYVAVAVAHSYCNRVEVSVKACDLADRSDANEDAEGGADEHVYWIRIFMTAHGFTEPAKITNLRGG